MKGNLIFTNSFLEKLQDNCGAITMVNHYINDLGMSYHDAILRFANHHSMKPEYVNDENRHLQPKIDINSIRKMVKNEPSTL